MSAVFWMGCFVIGWFVMLILLGIAASKMKE